MGRLAARDEAGPRREKGAQDTAGGSGRRPAVGPDGADVRAGGPFRAGGVDGGTDVHGHAGLSAGAEADAGGMPVQRDFVLQPVDRRDQRNAAGALAGGREMHPLRESAGEAAP